MLFLVFPLSLLFFALAWTRFNLALGLFIVSLPTYLIRFTLGPLPTTLLEIELLILFVVWVLRYARADGPSLRLIISRHRLFFLFVAGFILSSIISIFVSGRFFPALGLWRAYILEPILLFVILLARQQEITRGDMIWWLAWSTLSLTSYALVQQFTGWGISVASFRQEATRRVTAFYTSPNAIGLYLGPILILVLGDIVKRYHASCAPCLTLAALVRPRWNRSAYLLVALCVLAVIAIMGTKSEGALVALVAGSSLFCFLLGWRKTVAAVILAALCALAVLPSLRQAVLFQDKAGQNRVLLWRYSWEFLTASPQHFVVGTGLRAFFPKIQQPNYRPQQLEPLLYPHNIFLNFWTELGLLAMLAVSGMLWYVTRLSYREYRHGDRWHGAACLGALCALIIHGLVDVPYFKNDLAILFWILIWLTIAPRVPVDQARNER